MNGLETHLEFTLLSARNLSGLSEGGADDFVRLARKAYDEGNRGLAERCLRRAVGLSPTTANLHILLGRLQYERGKLAEARNSFEQALRLEPASGDAQLGMAASLQAMDMPSDAIYYYLSYLKDNPKSVDAMIYLAGAYQSTGQVDEAIETFEFACELEPGNPEVHGQYGRALFELGRIDEGTDHLRKAVELGAKDSELHRTLGLALEARDNVDGALAEFEHALTIDSRNVAARVELSTLLMEGHRFAEGLEHARTAVAIAREDGEGDYVLATALWQLGWAYYAMGAWRDSAQASRDALAIDPSLLPVRFNLALALLRDGHADEARAEYARAAEGVDDVWDLRMHGMNDLKAALADDPDLSGGDEILELLERHYRRLSASRSSSLPS
jgi:tetratricopeptide (TPR) repeat protein